MTPVPNVTISSDLRAAVDAGMQSVMKLQPGSTPAVVITAAQVVYDGPATDDGSPQTFQCVSSCHTSESSVVPSMLAQGCVELAGELLAQALEYPADEEERETPADPSGEIRSWVESILRHAARVVDDPALYEGLIAEAELIKPPHTQGV